MAPSSYQNYDEMEQALEKLQKNELSIIRLAEPVRLIKGEAKRSSDASADASDSPTPASFAADLSHYKELFSKLRFSYLEQVTKEKFLRAIVGDPPLIVEHQDNVELEAQLQIAKAELKAQKENVAAMSEELEAWGRDLSRRYEQVQLQTTQLSTLPTEIAMFEKRIESLRLQQDEQSKHPSLSLPLSGTLDLLSTRESEIEQLDRQIRSLETALPKRTRELERMESELRPFEVQKTTSVLTAKEAMRRKEEGQRGIGDELEMKGRWYRSAETCLQEALAIG